MQTTAMNAHPPILKGLPPETPVVEEPDDRTMPVSLWLCGLLAPAIYVGADLVAASRYPGFSVRDQAVSELFAIGAPTSHLVVPLFTLSSGLLLAYALGLYAFADRRPVRWLGIVLALSAIDALVLWNFFPMHMRGELRSPTDTMHLVFAANPFVLASLVIGAVVVRRWFRAYSIATIGVVIALGAFGFSFASAVAVNGPTPWMGLAERAAQYAYGVWQASLAVVLVRLSAIQPTR